MNVAVAVVWDDPRRFRLRRFGQVLTTAVGSSLVVVSGIGLAPLLLFGTTYAPTTSSAPGGKPQELPHPALWVWLLTLVLAVAGLIVGLRLVRRHRRLAVFLRRFGYQEATEAVTSVTASIGSSWRLVTLDDAQVAAVGVGTTAQKTIRLVDRASTTARRVAAIGKRVLAIAMLTSLVGVLAVGWITWDSGRDQSLPQHMIDLFGAPSVVGVLFTLLVVVFLAGAFVIALMAPLAILSILLLPVLFVALPVLRAVRDADATLTFRIDSPREVALRTDEVYQGSRRMFSPRMVVLTVVTEVWRDVVTALMARATAALVDVSELTDHMLWEIELLARSNDVRAVFVIHADRVWQVDQPGRLRELLDGQQVLAYTTDPDGLIRFARSLRAMLEAPLAVAGVQVARGCPGAATSPNPGDAPIDA
jgi:hypothetical protein